MVCLKLQAQIYDIFPFGGRCRKAMLGVWVCLWHNCDLLKSVPCRVKTELPIETVREISVTRHNDLRPALRQQKINGLLPSPGPGVRVHAMTITGRQRLQRRQLE